MLFNTIVIFAGLFVSLLLFYRFPILKKSTYIEPLYKISVIIPVRNEEINLSFLLQDLKNQIYPVHEVLCVDDCSIDNTAEIAVSFGVKLIRILEKPKDWTGKAWACQKGAEAASGEFLLFLDADVRLSQNAISSLMQAYDENQCVISIQPYHMTKKGYEQFSLFFNLIQISGNGTSTILNFKNPGLYGPVILINKEIYWDIEGHTSAKNSIVDDLTLGERLSQKGFPFKLFLGKDEISFRMYSRNFSNLLQGWIKNYATGALKTPPLLFAMVFLWVTSCFSAVICLVQSIVIQNWLYMITFLFSYLLWVIELYRISREIGNFKKYAIICYPVYIAFFLWVFIISFIKKMFHLNVVWKDRKIKLEK